MPRFPAAFAFLALLARFGGAAESADFLLPERPASLEILDRYEQPLSSKEKGTLPAYLPLRVVKEVSQLGDGITSVKEVRFEGHPYYLLRTDGADPAGVHRIRGGRVLDGVEKAAGADLRCATGAKPGGPLRVIRKGQTVQPIFASGAHAYVKVPGMKVEFAWCPAAGPFAAKELPARETAGREREAAVSAGVLDPELKAILEAKIESANQAYAAYTGAFNRLSGESRQPPYWKCANPGNAMECTLAGEPGSGSLSKSTAVLAEDLRKSLGGRPFDIDSESGTIKVAPRPEPQPPGKVQPEKGSRRP